MPWNKRLHYLRKGILGNDIHFLYECTKLDDLRTKNE